MTTITLNLSGIKFSNAFTTMVTKVTNPSQNSTIVLDSLKDVEISLGDHSAESLGLVKGSMVTISPVEKATDGSFTLKVDEVEKTTPKSNPVKGSSPARRMILSNDDL